jgi:acyl-coenzyme A synthetase/AMP-(fatty) acid ligase
MNKDNNLSQSLHAALLDSHNSCALINHVKKLNRTELLCDILGYMSWLDELNVHSVVVMSQPSIEALSLCYAIIFSNRVYIPVHRSTGSELIQTYLQEYHVDLLVIQPSLANQFDYSFNSELLVTQDKLFHYKRVEKHPKTMCILPGIIFFTSGSTGSPKAVYYDYNTLNDYLSWCVREFKLTPTDHLLFTTELSFIASLRPLFLPILSGTNVVFIESQGANKLALIINVLSKITMLNMTPTFLSIIVQYCEKNKCLASLASIRLILLSGEPINCSLVNYWMIQINPETVFYNLYGATEYLVPFYNKDNWDYCRR